MLDVNFCSELSYRPLQANQCGKPTRKCLFALLLIDNSLCIITMENAVFHHFHYYKEGPKFT